MDNWTPVSKFVSYSTKGITPKYVQHSSIMVLNQRCIRDNSIDYSFAQYTDDRQSISQDKFIRAGDILVNSTGTGTAGRCAFISRTPENYKLTVDSHILILRCNSYYEAQCLNYTLFSFEKTLMSFMTGSSGQSELDKVVLFGLKTKMPENPDNQQKIATILSTIDFKIELNNKINTELETIAKTIYDYWFVQFDFPDKNSKPYKSSGGKMVWSKELRREIPEGWEVGVLGNIGEIIGGSTPSKSDLTNFLANGIPWITPKDLSMNTDKKFIARGEVSISDKGIKSASLKILPKGSILMSSRAPVGYMAISRNPLTTNQGFKSFVLKDGFTTSFSYYIIKNLLPNIISNASGSTFKEISGGVLKTIKTYLPEKQVIKKFSEIVDPIFSKQSMLEIENEQLIKLRDWLLPMLMNGQVVVN